MTGPRLWAVVGATGTGKSEFALDLAETLRARGVGAEIVGADAMQLYRGMDIGTAKLPPAARRGIVHHMIDVLEVTEEAAVAWYQQHARAAIDGIHARGVDAILVGGSGLYVSSVIHDFRFPPTDPVRRAALEAEADAGGVGPLFERLRALDPGTAERIDPLNARRVIRALEVVESGGDTHGAALPDAPRLWCADTRVIGRTVPRDDLVLRLDRRVEDMWAEGLVDEADRLRDAGIERGVTARRAIGYAQALEVLHGTLTDADAKAQTQALTRRYARRQVSWFRRYTGVTWIGPGESLPETLLD